jgi:MFS transporter, PAT family, beta-lactamase induction signal transducer AmpG
MATETPKRSGWGDALHVYVERPVVSMLFLGFSAGLPFYLVFQTLSAWLRKEHIDRSTIGMLGWVGLMYTFKWAWAPLVDRVALPVLARLLGQRRSWILVAQIGVALCLFALSFGDPAHSITYVAAFAVATAFFAATQDIGIDAWRIESAKVDAQGAMAAAYQAGFRIALVVGQAGVFLIADNFGWHVGYLTMSVLMAASVITTLLVHEPQRPAGAITGQREHNEAEWLAMRARWARWTQSARAWLQRILRGISRAAAQISWPLWMRSAGIWFFGSAISPVIDFFTRYGLWLGLMIFAFIGVYRLTDFTMGTMTNPFYIDLGFTLTEIAAVIKIFGLLSSLGGVFIGGLVVAKFGRIGALLLGSVLIIISNVNYSLFGTHGCYIPLDCAQSGMFDFMQAHFSARGPATNAGVAAIVSFDNIALGVHGTALVAFLSSLTSARYTATQYAVLSSLYALPGKILMGTSGFVVNALGYGDFFLYTALLSVPGLLLLLWLARRHREIVART